MKRAVFVLLSIVFLLFGAAPSAAQATVTQDLSQDGLYFESEPATDVARAANQLATQNVAVAIYDRGDIDFAEAQAFEFMNTLDAANSSYHSVIVIGDSGVSMESVVLADDEQDRVLSAMVEDLGDANQGLALNKAYIALPDALVNRVEAEANQNDGRSGSSNGLEPGALGTEANSTNPNNPVELPDADTNTTDESSSEAGGGIGIGRILIFALIAFVGYKLLKGFLKRKARGALGGGSQGQSSGPFGQSSDDSSTGLPGGLGGSRRSGGLGGGLGSILAGGLGSILGGRRGGSSSTGLGGSLGNRQTQTSKSSGGNIFSGGKVNQGSSRTRRARRPRRGRSFGRSSRRKGKSF